MDSTDKSKAKPNPLRNLWPDVATEKGQSEAIKAGAVALVYLAVSYAIVIGIILSTGQDLMGALDGIEVALGLVFNAVAIVIAGLMAWFLYKRQNFIIACIGLAWVVLEVGIKLTSAPGRGAVVAVLALLFSINGVRGAWAAKKAKQALAAA